MFALLRAGRVVMYAGARRGPQGPPKRFGPVGWIVTLLVVGILAVHWWRVSLIILAVLVLFVIPCCLLTVRDRAQRPDPLDKAMRDLTGDRK